MHWRPSAALVLAVAALAVSLANIVVTATRDTNSQNIRDGTIQPPDLSEEVLAAELRGLAGERGATGERGRRGAAGPPGESGPIGPSGADVSSEVDDHESRLSELEDQMVDVCSTAVVVGYGVSFSGPAPLERRYLC